MPTVYKVVLAEEDGTLVSVIAKGKAKATYVPGRRTYPPVRGSRLLAFESKEAAKRFATGCHKAEVWTAKAPVVKFQDRLAFLELAEEHDYDTFFHWWANPTLLDQFSPPGTVACSSIVLGEKVW